MHQIPGTPGGMGRFLKNGGGQMKKGATTGSISHIETLLRLSPAADSSHPTCQGCKMSLVGNKL